MSNLSRVSLLSQPASNCGFGTPVPQTLISSLQTELLPLASLLQFTEKEEGLPTLSPLPSLASQSSWLYCKYLFRHRNRTLVLRREGSFLATVEQSSEEQEKSICCFGWSISLIPWEPSRDSLLSQLDSFPTQRVRGHFFCVPWAPFQWVSLNMRMREANSAMMELNELDSILRRRTA